MELKVYYSPILTSDASIAVCLKQIVLTGDTKNHRPHRNVHQTEEPRYAHEYCHDFAFFHQCRIVCSRRTDGRARAHLRRPDHHELAEQED
ncbi:hypothetical protein C8Q77DRAFT_263978 [Trametes polyzona]|nr:hypothetical protein C8Q77DRAFT_263978 [Trametes polyzona]